jgi:putative toxin-antitoxin system antitoxin component (TIGR02293 family)
MSEDQQSDRMSRLARVFVLAKEVLGAEDKAFLWMSSPNEALDGRRPVDLLDVGVDVRPVEEVLQRIRFGMFS